MLINLFVNVRGEQGVVQASVATLTQDLFQEMFRVMFEEGIQGEVVQVAVFLPLVMIVIDEIFNIEVRSNVLNFLQK